MTPPMDCNYQSLRKSSNAVIMRKIMIAGRQRGTDQSLILGKRIRSHVGMVPLPLHCFAS